jgi:tRNA(Ile)-lysidine synthase
VNPATASAVDPLAIWREPFGTEVRGIDAPVVVACSGGADSVALLALAGDAGLAPVAVHVDHALRAGSADEAAAVAAVATRLGADVRAVRAPVTAGPNLEARARGARYDALERARVDLGAGVVLVGHTADDQAETVLLNVLRGSAGSGLAGMAPRHGHVVRPLLGYRREQTRAMCAVLGLRVLADPMNDDRAFRRVAIRHDVLPMLSALAERDLVPVLARQADILRSESEYLDALAARAWPDADPPSARALLDMPLPLARRAVRQWVGAPPPSSLEVERVLAVAAGEARATELAGGRAVRRSGGRLALARGADQPFD